MNTCNVTKITRRNLPKYSLSMGTLLIASSSFPPFLMEEDKATNLEHLFKNPKKHTGKGRCPNSNCGMLLNMWTRTRHEFSNSEGTYTTCSIHCLADISQNSGESPQNIKATLYLHPEKMIAAEKAFYVIGSSAKGTMTMNSKVAFLTEGEANNYVREYGGTVVGFTAALTAATKELALSRPEIEGKGKKKRIVSEPTPETRCPVCSMYPANYPKHRSQLTTVDGTHHHFCSNQCLVLFMADRKQYMKKPAEIKSIRVSVYPDGGYEYAMGLYHLVGSNILGSMGKEPLPYRIKSAAEATAQEQGATVLYLTAITPANAIIH